MLREPVRVMRHDRVGGVMVSAQDYQAMRAFYADRLRQTMDKTADQAARAGLNDASALAHWVEVPPAIAAQDFCRDADDDKFIHAALAAKAPWLVTGDQDLLDLPPLPHLRILSPADATQNPEFCG